MMDIKLAEAKLRRIKSYRNEIEELYEAFTHGLEDKELLDEILEREHIDKNSDREHIATRLRLAMRKLDIKKHIIYRDWTREY